MVLLVEFGIEYGFGWAWCDTFTSGTERQKKKPPQLKQMFDFSSGARIYHHGDTSTDEEHQRKKSHTKKIASWTLISISNWRKRVERNSFCVHSADVFEWRQIVEHQRREEEWIQGKYVVLSYGENGREREKKLFSRLQWIHRIYVYNRVSVPRLQDNKSNGFRIVVCEFFIRLQWSDIEFAIRMGTMHTEEQLYFNALNIS